MSAVRGSGVEESEGAREGVSEGDWLYVETRTVPDVEDCCWIKAGC